ncbi:probable plastid-lipid-associated protein 3, chloroplastic isoform X1 [Phoenix dactylifera]|uniref:Probable plastid-lipid-associated protein 3, chloroplastic isoform X1 n=1 Tax=Phoenix dactylifera TaxID=42345 RepID=A0A8B7CIW5_PHODC|nr:probable plastid-lipid-associated protein 3, chloroplastic isoform X1 [Phoenix dactylifera]
MSGLLASSHPYLFSLNPKPLYRLLSLRSPSPSVPFSFASRNPRIICFSSPSAVPGEGRGRRRRRISISNSSNDEDRSPEPAGISDEWGEKAEPEAEPPSEADPPKDEDEWGREQGKAGAAARIVDEWGEEAEPEPEPLSDADTPMDEDEWGKEPGSGGMGYISGNGSPVPSDKLGDLKRCLVDTLYGTDFGLRASAEVRAEILELVNQLEAENPTRAPTTSPELLDGNWILLYTAFSELLPLLAVGATPLLKIKKISQAIDTKNMTIVNATMLSSPFATFSFSASASFEVRSPSRIQVQFKEGTFQPPEISSTVDLPEKVNIFGQLIDLKPVQQTLNPVQENIANITRAISGQPPLKVPLPGNSAQSWLLTTYLDQDFRISRGDGGLFVLAKEGSPLLDQLS